MKSLPNSKTNLPQVQKPGVMQMISEGASKRDLVRTFGALTLEKVIANKYPSIASIKRSMGLEKCEQAMGILILEASTFFEGGFDKETALELSTEILTQFPWLSLEDVFIVLQKLKKAKLFGKLTPNKVMALISEHNDERCALAGKISHSKHLATKDSRENYPETPSNADQTAFEAYLKQRKTNNLKTQ